MAFIVIGASQKPIIELLEKRQSIFLFSIPFILILTAFIGRFFADRILNPVFAITNMAQDITHEDLSKRIQTEKSDDEIRALANAFNSMISRLENSFKHIGEFSAQVAHELKTPIAIIRGECELALRKARSEEEYIRVLTVNIEEAKRMLKIIDDLLLLAKLDYRPELFDFKKFDVIKFFQEIYEQSVILAKNKNITVSIALPKEDVHLVGDRLHLRRLFFNVIHNSIKFTPPGGRIDIKLETNKRNIVIAITDTGIGIKEQDLPHIFDRFYHKESPTLTIESSTGLGLSIVQAIVKVHKGYVDVRSQLNKGTAFVITLPHC